jgi:hypothetical protein
MPDALRTVTHVEKGTAMSSAEVPAASKGQNTKLKVKKVTAVRAARNREMNIVAEPGAADISPARPKPGTPEDALDLYASRTKLRVEIKIDDREIDEHPQSDWPLDRLAQYARHQLGLWVEYGVAAAGLQIKAAVAAWRLGKAIQYAKRPLKQERRWSEWQDENGLNRGTVRNAILIATHYKSIEDVMGKTIAQLLTPFRKSRVGESQSEADHVHSNVIPTQPLITIVQTLVPLEDALTLLEAEPARANPEQLDVLEQRLAAHLARVRQIREAVIAANAPPSPLLTPSSTSPAIMSMTLSDWIDDGNGAPPTQESPTVHDVVAEVVAEVALSAAGAEASQP